MIGAVRSGYDMSKVLVTGASGFLGSHLIVQLLAAGHSVRATLRNLAREGEVRAMLAEGGADPKCDVSFVVADLESDAGWPAAVAGCDYVLHAASPLPAGEPADENELIMPAREGALRVLRAARDAGVKRVVLTSSFAAIGYGHAPRATPFDETCWTDTGVDGIGAYVKSKALAERAAWDFMAREGGGLELTVINPVGIFGPVLGPDLAASVMIVKAMMTGAIPLCPRIHFGVVDVRDVAALHLRAMTHPEAASERFLATAGDCLSLLDVAKALRAGMGAAARAPTRQAPDWLVRLLALWNANARRAVPNLGKIRNGTSAKARRMLGWTPRPAEEALVATAESLVQLGPLKLRKDGRT